MKFKSFVKDLSVNLKEGMTRFSVAFICTVLFYLTISYDIIFTARAYETSESLCMTFALVAVLSVLLKIAEEYMYQKCSRLMQYVLCAVSGIVAFILIKKHFTSVYMNTAYAGIIIALLCFIFFILMRGQTRDLVFPRLVASGMFTCAICGVLSIGLSVCLAAFQSLIFTWDDFYKVYLIVNLFIWVICFINVFLSFIPKKEVPVPHSKIFRTFVLFAGLPLYILLIFILLVYLAKIVITWKMPVGEINWFASFASLFFIFFLLSVKQYPEKMAKLYTKYGGYFLAPVLIMQAIAVFERINAYGLTTPRTVSLVLILISILFIAGSVIIPNHLNKIALFSGIIVLIFTVTPLNVIQMPIKSQTRILEAVLTANNMLKDGSIVPKPDISDEDAEKIISAYEYLKYNAQDTPDFIPDTEKTIEEIFGFPEKMGYDREANSYIHCSFCTKDSVDISAYNKMIHVSDNRDDFIKSGQYDIDLKPIALALYKVYGTKNAETDIYPIDENAALYFSQFSFDIENDKVTFCYFDGYLLLKN